MAYFFAGNAETYNLDPSEQSFNKQMGKAEEEIKSVAVFTSDDLRDGQGNVDKVIKELGGQGQIPVGRPKILGVLEETASSFVFAVIKATTVMTPRP